ncbi:MAG: hypothetical protein RBU45_15600 [Myxococcota bacterium]|jgi:uncharacterized membrane protein|nr:hypothetical protein [Myxococcota bacterium]
MKPKADIGKCLQQAWDLFKVEWQIWVLAALIFMGITTVALILLVIPLFFVAGALQAGMFHMALKQIKGQKLEVGDVFAGFSRYGDTTLLSIVVGLIVFGGTLLCIIPGLIFGAWYMFAYPLMMDRGMSWGDAMAESKKLVTQNIWEFVIFSLVAGFIMSVGSYACYVGILASFPLYYLMITLAYKDIFGLAEGGDALPATAEEEV